MKKDAKNWSANTSRRLSIEINLRGAEEFIKIFNILPLLNF